MIISIPKKIELRKSSVHGLGVFTTSFISNGEVIEFCPVIDIGLQKGESSHILIDYRFNWPQGTPDYSQVVCAGYGMLYNHSNDANANWRSHVEINCFEFYATRDIYCDEEIFVYYGDSNYWADGRNHVEVK